MTPDKKQNIYVAPETTEEVKFKLGFSLLMDECKRLDAKEAWIIAPAKGSYDGRIAQALGASQAKALSEKKPVTSGDVQIKGQYATRLPSIGDGVPVLAAYLSADSLREVDALFNVPSLIVVPGAPTIQEDNDSREWREIRRPRILPMQGQTVIENATTVREITEGGDTAGSEDKAT